MLQCQESLPLVHSFVSLCIQACVLFAFAKYIILFSESLQDYIPLWVECYFTEYPTTFLKQQTCA